MKSTPAWVKDINTVCKSAQCTHTVIKAVFVEAVVYNRIQWNSSLLLGAVALCSLKITI